MSTSASPRQSRAANLLLAAAVTVVFAGGLELAARATESRRRPSAVQEELRWDEAWNGDFYVTKSDHPGWPPGGTFNRDGVRDRPHAREKPAGVRRVVCLGDSVTLGPDGHPEQAWPQQLQERLDRLTPRAEVFNVALWGWSTRQERIAYEQVARPYRPDLVLLGICLNDISDLQNNLARPPRLLGALFAHSALVRRVVNAEGREIDGVLELVRQPEARRVREGFEMEYAEIRRLRQDVEGDGARLAILVFPLRAQLEDGAPDPAPQRRILDFCAREGLPCVDTRAALQPLGAPAAFVDPLHFTAQGSARVAESALALVPADLREPIHPLLAVAPEPVLQSALRDADPQRRREAAWRAGLRELPGLVPALTGALADGEESVRTAAAVALGRIGPAAATAVPRLAERLADARQGVRWAAAEALDRIGVDASQVPALLAALASDDLHVRAFAAWSVGRIGPPAQAAVPALVEMVNGHDAGLRLLAIKSLGRVGTREPAAIEALRSATSEDNAAVRGAARRALSRAEGGP